MLAGVLRGAARPKHSSPQALLNADGKDILDEFEWRRYYDKINSHTCNARNAGVTVAISVSF